MSWQTFDSIFAFTIITLMVLVPIMITRVKSYCLSATAMGLKIFGLFVGFIHAINFYIMYYYLRVGDSDINLVRFFLSSVSFATQLGFVMWMTHRLRIIHQTIETVKMRSRILESNLDRQTMEILDEYKAKCESPHEKEAFCDCSDWVNPFVPPTIRSRRVRHGPNNGNNPSGVGGESKNRKD